LLSSLFVYKNTRVKTDQICFVFLLSVHRKSRPCYWREKTHGFMNNPLEIQAVNKSYVVDGTVFCIFDTDPVRNPSFTHVAN
jgi:hypothetical protein